jgi:hypothetical protein
VAIGQNRSRKSAQCDRWSFCPTAGTVWSAEVKNFFASDIFRRIFNTRAIGEPAHWNNQSNSRLPLGARRRCSARSSILARRDTSHPCHANHVLSPRIVRIIQGLAEDWQRLDERIDHLSDEIAALARQDAGCERQCVLETRLRRPARRPLPKFESWAPLENPAVSRTAISVSCAVRSPAPTESKTCWGRCIVSVAM